MTRSHERNPGRHHPRPARRAPAEAGRAAGRRDRPLPGRVRDDAFLGEALKAYVEGQDNAVAVAVAGRLVTIRDMGKSQFVKILDQQGEIQLYVKKDVVGDDAYAAFKKLDLGDIVGARGTLFKTKTGEITVRVESYVAPREGAPAPAREVARPRRPRAGLPPALPRPRRQPRVARRLLLRSRVVSSIRRFLEARQFIEVETPVLQSVAGGAAAKPFTTHHNALGVDFFLRISLELYLKRLLVGGIDRVFEIGRIFRNEGISRKHNPEFTMLEVYQAYSDHRGMMVLVRTC
jgi:lysyl-tRNA synthetase class 2